MKKQVADFICEKYNWDDVVEETMKLYKKLGKAYGFLVWVVYQLIYIPKKIRELRILENMLMNRTRRLLHWIVMRITMIGVTK